MKDNTNSPEWRRHYLEFMYNPRNVENCSECPENTGASDWQGQKPCGQQNCWVSCHCGDMSITPD